MKPAFPMAFSASLFLVPVLGPTNDTANETLAEDLALVTPCTDWVCERYEPCDCSSGVHRIAAVLAPFDECNASSVSNDVAI